MSALIIVDLTPKDPEKLNQYSALAGKTLADFDGEFIAKGPIESLFGAAEYQTKVVIQFPSREKAENWYHSDDYQMLLELRTQGMDCQFHLVG